MTQRYSEGGNTVENPRRRCHLWISGRVQGVWFRAGAKRAADRLGLDGWVRNCSDGQVETVCEGQAADVAAFTDWCRQGPPLARIDKVDQIEEAPEGGLPGFVIR